MIGFDPIKGLAVGFVIAYPLRPRTRQDDPSEGIENGWRAGAHGVSKYGVMNSKSFLA